MYNQDFLEREGNLIIFYKLNHPKVVSDFIREVFHAKNAGYEIIDLDFSNVNAIFPNAGVPISGLMEFFETTGIEFIYDDAPQIIKPLKVSTNCESFNRGVLNKIWKFENSSDIGKLVDSFINELSKCDKFEKGVLNALEWSINEVMDNVIQHSNYSHGYVMGQIHKNSKHVAFTIFDTGQGIYNSLKNTVHSPKYVLDALTLCIKEGVTRDKSKGQGNGMYGLHSVVKENDGSLVITSGSGSYIFSNGDVKTYKGLPYPSYDNSCTTIDFQIDYNKPISIENALPFKNYKFVSLRIDNLETEFGDILYNLKEKAQGTGTRQSGERIRTEIGNIIRDTQKIIIIDFQGIAVISSSFADELIGKMVVEYGFFNFNNIIRMINMNDLCQTIVQRSVAQRMSESMNK
jgi:hypothetical protein